MIQSFFFIVLLYFNTIYGVFNNLPFHLFFIILCLRFIIKNFEHIENYYEYVIP